MEQIYSRITLAAQSAGEKQTASTQETAQEGLSFRDLLEKKHPSAEETSESAATSGDLAQEEPEEQKPAAGEELISQEQLLMAAMTTMQKPVVQMEQTVHEEQSTEASGPVTAMEPTRADSEGAVIEQPEQRAAQEQSAVELTQKQTAAVEDGAGDASSGPMDERTEGKDPSEGASRTFEQVENSRNEQNTEAETVVFREVREVPVKVGEAVNDESTEISVSVKDQISEQISKAVDQGDTRLTIQLNPRSLGRVDVEMTLKKDGTLHLELHAENPLTQQLLEKESAGLQSVLVRNTQQDVQVEVPRQQESQQQSFEDGRQGGQNRNPQQQREQHSGNDFLQKLRLGLEPLDTEES